MLASYLAAISFALLHFSTGDSQPGPYPEPQIWPCPEQNQYIVFPQYNPTSGSIFSNDPSVVSYTNAVIQALYNSPIAREVLDYRPLTAQDYSDFIYKFNTDFLKKVGYEDAEALAEFSVRSLAQNFDELTFPLMARYKANLAANYLFVQGVLTIANAKSLALKYVEFVEKYAQALLTSDPSSKFQVSARSFVDFIKAVDENAAAAAPLLVFYYGNEWFVAALNYKWSNQC